MDPLCQVSPNAEMPHLCGFQYLYDDFRKSRLIFLADYAYLTIQAYPTLPQLFYKFLSMDYCVNNNSKYFFGSDIFYLITFWIKPLPPPCVRGSGHNSGFFLFADSQTLSPPSTSVSHCFSTFWMHVSKKVERLTIFFLKYTPRGFWWIARVCPT